MAGKALFFSQNEGKGKIKIARVLQDGDKVAVHFSSEINGKTTINWYVFNFNAAGKVNEIWTNTINDMSPNASGHTMLDGTTSLADLDKTAANKATMKTFFDSVIIGGKFMQAGSYYNGDSLTQHDPHAGDDVNAITAYSMGLAKAGTPQIFNKVHLLLAEGNFCIGCHRLHAS